MFKKRMVKYEDVIQNEKTAIEFLTKNSDFFSVIVKIKKPYSQMPPVFNYDDKLRPYAMRYIFQEKDWLVDFLGKSRHQIMVVCHCCKGSRNELLQISNVFLPVENITPEDICFYRNNKLWFATISHEKIAFVVDATNEDIAFFRENGIRIGDGKTRDGSVSS